MAARRPSGASQGHAGCVSLRNRTRPLWRASIVATRSDVDRGDPPGSEPELSLNMSLKVTVLPV